MSDYGYNSNILTTGSNIMLLADPDRTRWKVGGITVDWSTVTALGADYTGANGTVYPAGTKMLPMGTVMTKITASGKYGPCDTAASDGRQTLVRSQCFLINEDVAEKPLNGSLLSSGASDHPGVFDGGTIWRGRLLVGGSGQVTFANFVIAFPAIDFASMT